MSSATPNILLSIVIITWSINFSCLQLFEWNGKHLGQGFQQSKSRSKIEPKSQNKSKISTSPLAPSPTLPQSSYRCHIIDFISEFHCCRNMARPFFKYRISSLCHLVCYLKKNSSSLPKVRSRQSTCAREGRLGIKIEILITRRGAIAIKLRGETTCKRWLIFRDFFFLFCLSGGVWCMNWRYEREGLSIFSHSFCYNDICFRKVRGSGLRLCGFSLTLNKNFQNYPVIFAWTSIISQFRQFWVICSLNFTVLSNKKI